MRKSVSVVIPAHDASRFLDACLAHLAASTVEPLECIVVDDGSTDDTADVARRHGAIVVATDARSGPAHARNLGARHARGDVLFFLDADVCVHPGTLHAVAASFDADPALDALIGAYDDAPESADFLSQYKNLMHAFVHQHGRREAKTFWSGCGAIRRDVFLAHSGFDESYDRPAIEDIELGYRLAAAGRKIVLDPSLSVKHLKRWTFWGLVKSDIFDRGIPWTELILRDRCMPNDLNIQLSQRVSVALVFVLLGLSAFAAVRWGGAFLVPLFALLFLQLSRYWLESASPRDSQAGALSIGLTMAGIATLAVLNGMWALALPLVLAYVVLFLRHRYAYRPHEPGRARTSLFFAGFFVLVLLLTMAHFPKDPVVFACFAVVAAIIALNNQFYLFLAAKRGRPFALAAIPFHLLYHLYNGVSFAVGLARYAIGQAGSPAQAEPAPLAALDSTSSASQAE
ncbi:glycosyltransferase [Candidatus Binatia bacterium]|nr:glycosyltransferase [Candidatus Binatia bacterium]